MPAQDKTAATDAITVVLRGPNGKVKQESNA